MSISILPTCLQDQPNEQFNPAYATIDRLIHGDTVARKCGLIVGDCIVAVNGEGFRRFAPDYEHNNELDELTTNLDGSVSISFDEDVKGATNDDDDDDDDKNKEEANNDNDQNKKEETETDKADKRLKYRVIPSGMNGGEAYKALIRAITDIKKASDPNNPLMLSLERYGWDSRVNSWPRYLAARNNNVPMAMKMIQEHEQWKSNTFPIDLRRPGLRVILKSKAIAEINIENVITPPTVYVDFGKLLGLEGSMATSKDIVDAFLINTELLLSKATDPTSPRVCQFIDLSDVNVKDLKVTLIQGIYKAFEPNYPETLHKMVMYPVTRVVVSGSFISSPEDPTKSYHYYCFLHHVL